MTLAVDEKTLPMATITGRTDRQTDGKTVRQTDRVRRNMRLPPREEGRIIKPSRIQMLVSLLFRPITTAESLIVLVNCFRVVVSEVVDATSTRIAIFADEAILGVARNVVPSVILRRPQTDAVLSFSPEIRLSVIPIDPVHVSDEFLSMRISHHEFPLKRRRRRGAWEFTLSSSPDIDSIFSITLASMVSGVCKQVTYTIHIARPIELDK